ncbi:hypothetical protein [Qipengyuania qiaonensis]|uniref:DUF4148 domain-containing protein n=1 Tax=Qipengyuania qiaonensis TaxID=2867240 RepID=A0ABS7J9S7_9SPHN|nr:hypothetical protein [Qipengyuania qiaonensis]MBX7484076.1 hypothetical protein [Qipengyuania qiaonensis]
MKSTNTLALIALCIAGAASAATMLHEEQIARAEEQLILTSPIAGIENHLWFDYRIDVTEAQKELTGDLRRASDLEDRRDAWAEYAHELKHEREDYIHDMAKRGYRQGKVYIRD